MSTPSERFEVVAAEPRWAVASVSSELHAHGPITLFLGYRDAVQRYMVAADQQDATAPNTFIPLFEALNWAVSLRDHLGQSAPLRHRLVTALGFARDRVHHDWAAAVEVRTVPVAATVGPFSIAGETIEWFWKPVERLPRSSGSRREARAYAELLAKSRHATLSLNSCRCSASTSAPLATEAARRLVRAQHPTKFVARAAMPDNDLQADLISAAEDAAVDPDIVLVLDAEPHAGDTHGAMYYPPSCWVSPGRATFKYTLGERQRINARRDGHVVVLARGMAPPRRRLVLRHELEHVAQHIRSRAVGEATTRLDRALEHRFFYRAMPHERDADAAATAFARRVGIGAVQIPEKDDRYLYDAPWDAPDPESLARRVFAFSLFYPDRFDRESATNDPADQLTTDDLLNGLLPDGARVWAALRGKSRDVIVEIGAPADCSIEEWESYGEQHRHEIADSIAAELARKESEVVASLVSPS